MGVAARPVALTGADQLVRTGGAIYRGFSVRETSGAASATLRIYDGTAVSALLLDAVQLGPGESAREWYGDGGLWAADGVFVDVVSGTVEGSVRVG